MGKAPLPLLEEGKAAGLRTDAELMPGLVEFSSSLVYIQLLFIGHRFCSECYSGCCRYLN